jgi:hypothetical protein
MNMPVTLIDLTDFAAKIPLLAICHSSTMFAASNGTK